MSVAFVFSNPGHHLEMMSPVARELASRGVDCTLVSLAELRGYRTPRNDPRLRRAIPLNLRKQSGAPSPQDSSTKPPWSRGRLAQQVVWQALRMRLRPMLRRARVVVIANDAVYPYHELVGDLHRRDLPTVLMQEGIRFPLPSGYHGPVYGASGNAAVCAWGEGSRDYFVASKVPRDSIAVTGTPRLDEIDPASWQDRGRELLAANRLESRPIALLSNPIEIQGYGPKQVKLDLVARFLAEAAPAVRARQIPIIVKTHLYEDPADFARLAAASPIGDLVTILRKDVPIFAAIAASRAAVVLTSTVGLEALMFGLPLAVLEIPGHEFAFEYVQREAAIPLCAGTIQAGVEELLDNPPSRQRASASFVERHLHDRGRARYNVAAVIQRVLRGSHG